MADNVIPFLFFLSVKLYRFFFHCACLSPTIRFYSYGESIKLSPQNLNLFQSSALVILRIAIGWHFCFEGITKLTKSEWTSAGYLNYATGPFASVFSQIPENPTLLYLTDQITIWVLTLGGLCLILGLFTRTACISCAVLLTLFYLASPPFPLWWFSNMDQYSSELSSAYWAGMQQPGTEGTYFIVNKNLIELIALIVLFSFDTGKLSGFDVWIHSFVQSKKSE